LPVSRFIGFIVPNRSCYFTNICHN
jgi:hypothetical protein